MKCSKCGAILEDGVLFCRECGAKVEAQPKKRFCRECGATVPDGAKFCTECGARIVNIENIAVNSPVRETHS